MANPVWENLGIEERCRTKWKRARAIPSVLTPERLREAMDDLPDGGSLPGIRRRERRSGMRRPAEKARRGRHRKAAAQRRAVIRNRYLPEQGPHISRKAVWSRNDSRNPPVFKRGMVLQSPRTSAPACSGTDSRTGQAPERRRPQGSKGIFQRSLAVRHDSQDY